MKYLILLEFDSKIELNAAILANNIFRAVQTTMPELGNVTVHYDEAVRRAVDRIIPSTPTAPTPTYSAPSAPNAAVLAAVLDAGRSILANNSETDAQSDDYGNLLDAYEQLIALIATGSSDDPSIIALSRAALTAGLF